MVGAREPAQLGDGDEDSRTDPADQQLFVGDHVVEGAATDREHPSGLYAPHEELVILREGSAGWRLALGDVGLLALGDVDF